MLGGDSKLNCKTVFIDVLGNHIPLLLQKPIKTEDTSNLPNIVNFIFLRLQNYKS